jgi:hypothetical protein
MIKMFDIDKILGKRTVVKKGRDPFNNIFGLEKKQSPKSPVNPNVISMFKGKGNPMLGDRVTKPQRQAMRKSPWADWDGDGVINGLDCAPKNKKRHMTKVDLEEYGKNEHVSKFGFNPKKTIVHGTSLKNALEIKRTKEFREGSFTNPGRGGFETAKTWAENVYKDEPVVVIAETDRPVHNRWGSYGHVGKRAKEWKSEDRSFPTLPLKKVKILTIEDDNKLSDENEYNKIKVYHGTNRGNIQSIKEKGLLEDESVNKYQERNPYKNYSFWTTDKDMAKRYGNAIISTKIDEDQYKQGMQLSRERTPQKELRIKGEVLVKGKINPEDIEVEDD